MTYEAVIFDLFGTLIDYLPYEEWKRSHSAVASVMCVSADEVRRAGRVTKPDRDVGRFGSLENDIRRICEVLCLSPTAEQIERVARIRLDINRRNLETMPKPGVFETLAALRRSGRKIGLVSDCTKEIPMVWAESKFAPLMDAAVFSCEARVSKPDPRIYEMACERLAVVPEKCLYVGDGGSHELNGAAQVGMTPILIRSYYDGDYDVSQPDATDWTGLTISDLSEVMGLLGST